MSEGTKPVRVGLLGCGTVGGGVVRILHERGDELAARVGAPIEVKRVLVRDPSKEREPAVQASWITTDPEEVLADPDIDVVVEVVGGEADALRFIRRGIGAKKAVVTANKLVLAVHGRELLEAAVDAGVDLAFEAAVGGGIPIVRTLREAFASDRIDAMVGILNGTSNYVLTRMLDDGLTMDDAVADAQRLGYAEADPSMDIGGVDAAHKLAILSLLGFGVATDHDAFAVEGLEAVEPVDHRFAERFGYRIKPLAIGRRHDDGGIELRVHPALVRERSVLANVSGVLNAVLLEGASVGPSLVYGRGAGALPTAVSVVSDVMDVARSHVAGVAGLSTRSIHYRTGTPRPLGDVETRYYVRFTVRDEPGVMARLAGALGAAGVSIEQLVQDGLAKPGQAVPVVLLTHLARERAVREALEALNPESFLVRPPLVLRIEAW